VPNNDYRGLLRQRRPELLRPGNLCDTAGRRIGVHAGVAAYTIGQRRGLGVALGRPAYVTRLDVINNVVTLGTKDDLLSDGLDADDVNWLVDVPSPDAERIVQIKIRHLHTPAGGRIRVLPDGAVSVRFDQPQLAVTPGQAAVFYEDDIVLGGGWIRDSLPPASA
jgi:tRNA-specific 2-thiouridylase